MYRRTDREGCRDRQRGMRERERGGQRKNYRVKKRQTERGGGGGRGTESLRRQYGIINRLYSVLQ